VKHTTHKNGEIQVFLSDEIFQRNGPQAEGLRPTFNRVHTENDGVAVTLKRLNLGGTRFEFRLSLVITYHNGASGRARDFP
jgi:hypothetical protein